MQPNQWRLADENRATRFLGASLLGLGTFNLMAYFFPMYLRGAEATFADNMHATLAALTVLFILPALAFGASAFGAQFRLYSLATIMILVLPASSPSFMLPMSRQICLRLGSDFRSALPSIA